MEKEEEERKLSDQQDQDQGSLNKLGIDERKQYSVLLLGISGHGKTSLAYTLTKNDVFKAKAGMKSGSLEIVHGKSKDKSKDYLFTVFDTIGYDHEDFESSKIEQKIMDYLKDHSAGIFSLNCILFVVNIKSRSSMNKMKHNFANFTIFKPELHLILLITGCDEMYDDEQYEECKENILRFADDFLGEGGRKKVIWWINEIPSKKKINFRT